jgi:hypothetical protein
MLKKVTFEFACEFGDVYEVSFERNWDNSKYELVSVIADGHIPVDLYEPGYDDLIRLCRNEIVSNRMNVAEFDFGIGL